jgi:hypothetical protein
MKAQRGWDTIWHQNGTERKVSKPTNRAVSPIGFFGDLSDGI